MSVHHSILPAPNLKGNKSGQTEKLVSEIDVLAGCQLKYLEKDAFNVTHLGLPARGVDIPKSKYGLFLQNTGTTMINALSDDTNISQISVKDETSSLRHDSPSHLPLDQP